jgi:hypothetical protein
MINGQDLIPIKPHVNKCFVPGRKPELTELLILANEVRTRDPKRERPGGMTGNPDDGIVLSVNPDFPFEQVFVLSFRVSFTSTPGMTSACPCPPPAVITPSIEADAGSGDETFAT